MKNPTVSFVSSGLEFEAQLHIIAFGVYIFLHLAQNLCFVTAFFPFGMHFEYGYCFLSEDFLLGNYFRFIYWSVQHYLFTVFQVEPDLFL